MTTIAPPAPALATRDRTSVEHSAIPWYLWAVAFASTSVIIGVTWDISWHCTIGRDTFWTAAHLAIYLGGAVAGLSCGWLVLATTFTGTERDKTASVSFWGFRGPLGAWVCIWGSFAMITSGPLDDWWHNAYGLDVEILSPPHMVLAAGILAIQIGAMLMALARQNNAPEGARGPQFLFVYAAGVLILMLATLGTEYITFPHDQHGTLFFLVSALIFPFVLVGLARSTRFGWGATGAATIYMGVTVIMIWVLQLFEARPMLAPILRQVDHMVPPAFPILLVIPAAAVDLLMTRMPGGARRLRQWGTAMSAGVVLMLVLGVVQWYFAEFLLSEGARTFVFAADQWDYNSSPGAWQYEFWSEPVTLAGAGWTALVTVMSASAGLWWGNWMKRVRR
ncbi:MAG: hypothetical protein IH939_16300 [Acidobacteria bacterium]|nr:hypothetical protein [Acidobacteriota bacterium]